MSKFTEHADELHKRYLKNKENELIDKALRAASNNVRNTYQELERLYGEKGKDWDLLMQSTDGEFDYMRIKLSDGTIKTVDIKLRQPHPH